MIDGVSFLIKKETSKRASVQTFTRAMLIESDGYLLALWLCRGRFSLDERLNNWHRNGSRLGAQ